MQIEEAGEKLHIEWRYHEFRRVGMRGGSDYCGWKKKKNTEILWAHVESCRSRNNDAMYWKLLNYHDEELKSMLSY